MEISKGMYIRTKKGIIRKWSEYDVLIKEWEDRFNYNDEDGDLNFVFEDGIAKYSNNIIDLIEVGDYVNSMCVIAKDSDNRLYVAEDLGEPYYREFYNGCFDYTLLETDNFKIKDIVTKEQFNACKYVVERDTNENI